MGVYLFLRIPKEVPNRIGPYLGLTRAFSSSALHVSKVMPCTVLSSPQEVLTSHLSRPGARASFTATSPQV